MQIRYAASEDIETIRALWDEGFPGEEAYKGFFFDVLYRPEQALCLFEGEKAVAMAHLLPGELRTAKGASLACAYIYAVATHGAYRGRGLASQIMDQAFFDLHLRGVPLCALVPQSEGLFDFYRRFDFEPVFYLGESESISAAPSEGNWRRGTEEDIPTLQGIYDRAMDGRAHMARGAGDWAVRFRELEVLGSGVVLSFDGEQPGAYAVYHTGKEGAVVECLGLTPESERLARDAALAGTGKKEGVILRHPAKDEKVPFASMKIVKAQQVLEAAGGHVLEGGPVTLEDRYCPWNNGTYFSRDGKVARGDMAGRSMDPAALCRSVFVDQDGFLPYMNLMFN